MIPGEDHHAGDGGYEESTWEKHNAFVAERNKSMEFRIPAWICPVHGRTTHVLSSTIPGHETELCLICYIDKLIELGVQKVKKEQE